MTCVSEDLTAIIDTDLTLTIKTKLAKCDNKTADVEEGWMTKASPNHDGGMLRDAVIRHDTHTHTVTKTA